MVRALEVPLTRCGTPAKQAPHFASVSKGAPRVVVGVPRGREPPGGGSVGGESGGAAPPGGGSAEGEATPPATKSARAKARATECSAEPKPAPAAWSCRRRAALRVLQPPVPGGDAGAGGGARRRRVLGACAGPQ